MLHPNTLQEIRQNTNTGVEYEIVLFYQLLLDEEQRCDVLEAVKVRKDCDKILRIIKNTDTRPIYIALEERGFTLEDISFETQNDEVGPSDIVMYLTDAAHRKSRIGLSVKYANTCTLNVTGRKFTGENRIDELWNKYLITYLPEFRQQMANLYGNAKNWHRKESPITTNFIDEIRNAVIENWPHIDNKGDLLSNLFHKTSPIDFWVIQYGTRGYSLQTEPSTVDISRANDVVVRKYETSYVAFYLDDIRIGKMQVKFNNGFIESIFNRKGVRKKRNADFIQDGLEFIYGRPFGSWNFSVEK